MAEMTAAIKRCGWAAKGDPLEQSYHDDEWGVPVHDDATLFEFLTLEGAQAGLSWRTILHKRDNYRRVFLDWDVQRIARIRSAGVEKRLLDPGIVRNRLKVQSTISNAKAFLAVQAEFSSFADYLWGFVDGEPVLNRWRNMRQVPVSTALSDSLSKDLKQRGFRFVGSTIVYAYLQAVGVVNDHLTGCFRYHGGNPSVNCGQRAD